MTVTLADLHWTAGFLDAKGSFYVTYADDGYARPMYRVTHKRPGVLERLRDLYGGCVTRSTGTRRWRITGRRAVGLAFTVYSLLSERRRREIERMVAVWMKSSEKKVRRRAA